MDSTCLKTFALYFDEKLQYSQLNPICPFFILLKISSDCFKRIPYIEINAKMKETDISELSERFLALNIFQYTIFNLYLCLALAINEEMTVRWGLRGQVPGVTSVTTHHQPLITAATRRGFYLNGMF